MRFFNKHRTFFKKFTDLGYKKLSNEGVCGANSKWSYVATFVVLVTSAVTSSVLLKELDKYERKNAKE